MNRIIILVLLVVAAVAVFYFTMRPAAESAQQATTISQTTRATTTTVHEQTSTYTIDVQYPQFGVSEIDTQIKKIVDDTITEVKGYPANPPGIASPQNELTMRYESPYVGPDVVGVKLIISEYTGGAHPNTLISGVNFDRATGKRLLQDDAFKMIGMSVDQVSASATAQLKQKLGDVMFPEGANTYPENFSSFLIGSSTVTFIFQPYQVAAYAAGAQEASFPRRK